MADNIDSIEKKIRALMSKTVDNGATQGEMEAALAKAAELMTAYGITKLREKGTRVGMTKPARGPFTRYDAWLAEAASIVMACKVVGAGKNNLAAFYFVGGEEAREAAKQAFVSMRVQVAWMVKERRRLRADFLSRYKINHAAYSREYREGVCMRVLMRAREWVAEQRSRETPSEGGHSALVVAGYFDSCARENAEFLEGEGVGKLSEDSVINRATSQDKATGEMLVGFRDGAKVAIKEEKKLA